MASVAASEPVVVLVVVACEDVDVAVAVDADVDFSCGVCCCAASARSLRRRRALISLILSISSWWLISVDAEDGAECRCPVGVCEDFSRSVGNECLPALLPVLVLVPTLLPLPVLEGAIAVTGSVSSRRRRRSRRCATACACVCACACPGVSSSALTVHGRRSLREPLPDMLRVHLSLSSTSTSSRHSTVNSQHIAVGTRIIPVPGTINNRFLLSSWFR